jgi:hypothetical protein
MGMTRLKEGDLVTTRQPLRFLDGSGKIFLEIPPGVHGIVKRAGPRLSVKFVGYPRCTVSEKEIEAANPLDVIAWDFGEMDEHPVIEPEGA